MDIYKENGYNSRLDYLHCLAEDYGAPIDHVLALADVFTESEDFDGLVTALEDYYEG